MTFPRWRRLTLLLVALLTLGLIAPSAASARPATTTHIRGGTTTLVTAPGVVTGLLGAKIVAFPTAPATASLHPSTVPTLTARYPVTAGTLATRPVSAAYGHRGGLFLENLDNGKSVTVDSFVVNTRARTLTAHLVGTNSRLTVFSLDLAKAKITLRRHAVSITGVRLILVKSAADGLNLLLGTTAFKANSLFGTAASGLRI